MPCVTVVIRDEAKKIEFANISIAFLFEIVDFDNVILLNDQKVHVIPPPLESTIKPVAISTARGILYSELRGTYLNNIIMPVVYMDAFKEIKTEESNA